MRGKPITAKPSKIMWNGEYVLLSSLTPEQKAQKEAEYSERIQKVVQRYVDAHPEFFDIICKTNEEASRNANS